MLKNFFECKDYNTPVYETENFVVIPSLGALVEGWLLIVPKVFYLNFSELPIEKLKEVNQIVDHLESCYRPLFKASGSVVFEHGPAMKQSTAGCGVDYAHLHWVPIDFDLVKGVSDFLNLRYEWQSIRGLEDINSNVVIGKDYLYSRDQYGKSVMTSQEEVPSQTFRKVIAHYLEQPEKFDWKANFGSENISAVYSKLNLTRV